MNIAEWATNSVNMFNGSTWIIQVFVVIFATLLFNFFIKILHKKLLARAVTTATKWDETFINAANLPLQVLIWVIGITLAMDIVQSYAGKSIFFKLVEPLRTLGVIITLAWFINRFIRYSIINITEKKDEPVDKTTALAIGQLLQISVVITSVLVILETLGFDITGVLAFGGIGGIAVSFAAKDLLANFFGGLMIYLDRPFAIGDWVRSPDRNIEGTVEYIGWRLTRIRTFDKRPLYVPNSIFSTVSVENPSRMFNRRIKTQIGIRYDDARHMRRIVSDIQHMLKEHPDLDATQTTMTFFDNFGPSSLDILVYAFTKTTGWAEYLAVQQDVFLRIIDIVAKNGAECAFPTTTLHLPEGIDANLTT